MSFIFTLDNYQAIKSTLKEFRILFRPEYFSRREAIAPPMPLWSIYSTFNKAKLAPAEWGMLPNWDTKRRITRPLTVARVETLNERVSYKNLLPRYRALIPVNGFTVRSNSRTVSDIYKFYQVENPYQPCMMLAALYQFNVDGNMQVVLLSKSKKATELHRSVRMPLIIEKENWNEWLNSEKKSRINHLLEKQSSQDLSFTTL